MSGASLEQILLDAIPAVLIGAFAGGLYGVARPFIFDHQPQRKANWTKQLEFQPEAFDVDPDCAVLFLKLQKYRALSPELFDEAGLDTDSLFCLEKQLSKGEVAWDASYARIANRYLRQICNYLNDFVALTKRQLYTEPLAGRNETALLRVDPEAYKQVQRGKTISKEVLDLVWQIQPRLQRRVKHICGAFRRG